MNFFTNILRDIFHHGTDFSKSVSGEEAIAKGATIYAARLSQVSQSPVINKLEIHDALPLSIGVRIAGNRFRPILENNSEIPSSGRISLRTTENNQQAIYEGLDEDNINGNTCIGKITVNGIPPREAGAVNIILTLELNDNGILQAKAEISGTDIKVEVKIEYQVTFEQNVTRNELSAIL